MKKYYKLIVLLLIINNSFGQINVSKEKVLINNKCYYIHLVGKGETIYSISKAYNAALGDIIAENDGILDGLKEKQSIKIPCNKDDFAASKEDDRSFVLHKVAKKETLWSILQKYNIDESQLIKWNPTVSGGLKEEQIIKIPLPTKEKFIFYRIDKKETIYSIAQKFGTDTYKIEELNPENAGKIEKGQIIKIPNKNYTPEIPKEKYIYHKVEYKETVYSIAKKYNIEKDVIISENKLSEKVIKMGDLLKIPVDKIKVQQDTIIDNKLNNYYPCNKFDYKKYTFRVAVLLPFFLEDNEPNKPIFQKTKSVIQFYQGFLLAVNKLKEDGVLLDIYTYDVGKEEEKVRRVLLNNPILKTMDLIVGPAYISNTGVASEFAKENKINITSPLSSDVYNFTKENPYFFGINQSDDNISNMISSFVKDKFRNINCVAISNETKEENDFIEPLKNNLFDNFINLKEVIYKKDGLDKIKANLSINQENIIFLPTTDKTFAEVLITKLSTLYKTYKITIFAPFEWKNFSNIGKESFSNLNIYLYNSSYIDVNEEVVKNFKDDFKNVYKYNPQRYSYIGYDVMYYFGSQLKKSGKEFQYCLPFETMSLLMGNYNMKRIDDNSGFENNTINLFKYNKISKTFDRSNYNY